MARIATTVLVVGLLVGTAGAFALTERLKLVRSPIAGPEVDRVFSPVCRCAEDEASIAFRLREGDRLTVAIVDDGGEVVRTLVEGQRVPAGPFETSWDGRDARGEVAAEGVYRPRVHLAEERRTIVIPNPIRVDTTAPFVYRTVLSADGFSPDGDGRNDKLTVRYRFSEAARGLLFVDRDRVVRTRSQQPRDKLDWPGRRGGRALPAGTYTVELAAEDRARNVSTRTEPRRVRIRYVELARSVFRTPAGLRFGVRVRSDAERIRWRFAGGSRTARPGLLVLRAPRKPGRYTLFVEANGHGVRARVIVSPRER